MFGFNRMLDLDGVGLGMFLLPYQVDALEYLYDVGEAGSRDVWLHINREGAPDPKSRAAVINFLNKMVEENLVTYRDTTGKGGHHRVYQAKGTTVEAVRRELVRRLLTKVASEFGAVLSIRWHGMEEAWFIDGEGDLDEP